MESKSHRLINLAAHKQIICSKDASGLGVPQNYLPRLVRKGILKNSGAGSMLPNRRP